MAKVVRQCLRVDDENDYEVTENLLKVLWCGVGLWIVDTEFNFARRV